MLNTEKKKKKVTITSVKKKTWTLCSIWVRNRGSIDGNNTCCTCNKVYPVKMLQAGHFVSRRHNSTLFHLANIHPQCYMCNVVLKGNCGEYALFLKETYGEGIIEELVKKSREPHQFTMGELKELQEFFKIIN